MNDLVKNLGAELGAAKAENERLRGLLERIRTTCCQVRDAQDLDTAPGLSAAESLHEQIEKLDAALSQQAEPASYGHIDQFGELASSAVSFSVPAPAQQAICDAITYGVGMIAEGKRVEPMSIYEQAPAQDEREAFEAHMRLGGYSNPEKHPDGSYVSSAMELWWQGWKARATRPAQTEQQPVSWQFYQDGKWWNGDDRIKDHRKNTEAAGIPVRDLYAAPIAQTALSAERDRLRDEIEALRGQLAESQANDRTAMGYLSDVRQIVGGDDFPSMVANVARMAEIRCEGCGYMTHHREHMGCVRAAMAAKEASDEPS